MATRKTPPTPAARSRVTPRPAARRKAPAAKAAAPQATQGVTAPRSKTAVPAAAANKDGSAAKAAKPGKRHKPVRDSFTMPPDDFALIAMLKQRALAGQREAKKSELLRAGLHALAGMDTSALVAALSKLAPVKVGRPKKG